MERKAINQEEDLLRQITIAIKYSSPGSFIFIESNRPLERKEFPEKIKTQGIERSVFYININEDLPQNLPLHKTIEEWLKDKIKENASPVLFLDGFDRLFQDSGKAREWLETFNFSREALSSINAVLVFLAPVFCMDLFRRYAPDLWAWRAFFFTIPQDEGLSQTREMLQSLDMGENISPQDNPEKRNSRINILKKLLEEELERHGSIEAVWNNILYPLSQELIVSGRYDESHEILKKAEKWIDSTPETKEASEYFNQMGNLNYYKGNLLEAEEYLKKSFNIVKELGNISQVSRYLHQIGVIHQDLGEYQEALGLYEKALKIAEDLGDRAGVSTSLHQIGMIHQDQGEYKKALGFYEKALKIAEELGNRNGVAKSLHNIGVIHQDLGEYEKALGFYEKALKIAEELGNRDGVAKSLHNIGVIHQDLGEYEKALGVLEKALKIAEELGDRDNIAISLGKMGELFKQLRNFPESLEYLLMALQIFSELQSPNVNLALKELNELREQWGAEGFDKAFQKKTGEEFGKRLLIIHRGGFKK